MQLKKRILALSAILALLVSSFIAIGTSVAGQPIETSITVLEGACVDDPTTLGLTFADGPTWDPDTASPGAWIGTGYPNTDPARQASNAVLDMNVSDCAGGWIVDATISDFVSAEGNTISATEHFYMRPGTSNGRALGPYLNCDWPGIPCYESETQLLGTYGHYGPTSPSNPGAGSWGQDIRFGGSGPDYSVQASYPLMTGDETAVGPMWARWEVRWDGLEHITDTPPGQYTGVLKMTFTPNNP